MGCRLPIALASLAWTGRQLYRRHVALVEMRESAAWTSYQLGTLLDTSGLQTGRIDLDEFERRAKERADLYWQSWLPRAGAKVSHG